MSQRSRQKRETGVDILRARALRQSGTEAERRLWRELRSHRFAGYKFRRQHPLGPFILDFFCYEAMLAVELDGGQHGVPEAAKSDRRREGWLAKGGVRVLRFWNNDVLRDTESVLEAIWRELCPHPDPLPGRGRSRPRLAAWAWPRCRRLTDQIRIWRAPACVG